MSGRRGVGGREGFDGDEKEEVQWVFKRTQSIHSGQICQQGIKPRLLRWGAIWPFTSSVTEQKSFVRSIGSLRPCLENLEDFPRDDIS